jgi:hypothetical protein
MSHQGLFSNDDEIVRYVFTTLFRKKGRNMLYPRYSERRVFDLYQHLDSGYLGDNRVVDVMIQIYYMKCKEIGAVFHYPEINPNFGMTREEYEDGVANMLALVSM